jgi:hypothetical protein
MQATAALRVEFDDKLNETELALTGRVQSDLAGKAAAASQVEARLEGLRWAAAPAGPMKVLAGCCFICSASASTTMSQLFQCLAAAASVSARHAV